MTPAVTLAGRHLARARQRALIPLYLGRNAKGEISSCLAQNFEVTPERYAAIKEATLRALKSYEQTEAYALAGHRRAISRSARQSGRSPLG